MPEKSDKLENEIPTEKTQALRTLFVECQIHVISCLYWKNRAPWEIEWRTCPDSLLLFPMSGGFQATLKGAAFPVKPGSFLMIPENAGHRLEILSSSRQLLQFSLHCQIHDRWGRPILSRFPSALGRLPSLEVWKRNLAELTSILNKDAELGQARGMILIRELLAAQWDLGIRMEPLPEARDPRVSLVLQIMKRDLALPSLSVESLASEVHLTPMRLRTLFTRDTGMSPKRFLNTLRLREAARLLCQSENRIKEIAADCGFASDHYFHLVFRQAFGCTPTNYRRKLLREL